MEENQVFEEELPELENPVITTPVVTFDTPRTTDKDRFIDLNVFHDGVFVWPTTVAPNDPSTQEVYERAINGEFGVINIAPSADYMWNDENNEWVLIPVTPPMPTFLNSNNTIVDTNGNIKTASPVIQLGVVRVKDEQGNYTGEVKAVVTPVTQEARDANISAVRVFKGRYVITGVFGTHEDEQWAISVPSDVNGNPLVWVNYRVAYQGENVNADFPEEEPYYADMGDIVLDTYHRTHPNAPIFAQNNLFKVGDWYIRADKLPEGVVGEKVEEMADIDIPLGKGQFLDIRVNV